MPPAPIRTKPRPQWFTCGPFRGVRDSPQPGAADPSLAESATNVYVERGPQGVGLVQRPGLGAMGSVIVEPGEGDDFDPYRAPQVIGQAQAVTTWTDAVGVRRTVAVAGGQIWTYDWAADLWTVSVTDANLTTASVTLSTTARVSLVPFAGKLMVSDGVNDLITWTGASGAGGITQIANVGPFYGPLTVYYAKLFGILQDDAGAGPRKTLVWSEENDPTLGYNIAPYNNAWDNPGAYTEPLTACVGTNEALYVFRERRTIAITGAVNADFETAGTRANVSETEGTSSPWAVRALDAGVWFVDRDLSPWMARVGAAEPMWLGADCERTLNDYSKTQEAVAFAMVAWDGATDHLILGTPTLQNESETDFQMTRFLVWHVPTLQFVGEWTIPGLGASVLGEVVDAQIRPRTAVMRFLAPYVFDVRGGRMVTDYQLQTERAEFEFTIPCAVKTPVQGYDWADEVRVDAIELSMPSTTLRQVEVGYETTRGATPVQVVPIPGSASGFTLGVDALGVGALGGSAVSRRRATARCFGRGRGVQALAHVERELVSRATTIPGRFTLDAVRIRCYGVPSAHAAP